MHNYSFYSFLFYPQSLNNGVIFNRELNLMVCILDDILQVTEFSNCSLQFYNIMHKKTEKNNYALASSIISDIPLSIGQRDSQAPCKANAGEFKQNSSIYHTFNQSRSRTDESLSLHFSTARPFYGEVGEDYYQAREICEKRNYNIEQKEDYIMERVKSKKSPNKKIMIYSYSNIVLFQKRVGKIFLELKKRIFMMLYRVKKEERTYFLHANNKNTSFYSGQTNNTSREDALYRISFGAKKQERYGLTQQNLQGIKIIQGWSEYRMLLDKRKTLNMIMQFGSDRKKFSLELSQSLKVDNAHYQNYFGTDYNHSNEISLTNALPQQIQESLVYTLENNSESTRKELTQSTLQKLPTLKNYPTFPHLKQKTSNKESESETSKKNSPMLKLKSFNSSHASQKQEIKKKMPLNIQSITLKNVSINMDSLNDMPVLCEDLPFQQENKIDDHEVTAQVNEINVNLQQNDTNQSNDFDVELKKIVIRSSNQHQKSRVIQQSAKFSDVSSYRMENTVHKQQQTYQAIPNHLKNHTQRVIQDQTVIRRAQILPFQDKNINSNKVQRIYIASNQANNAIMTPRFTSEIRSDYIMPQKLVSQLDNDRIRIFARPNQQTLQRIQQKVVVSLRNTQIRGNLSPQVTTITRNKPVIMTSSSEKKIMSPKMQTQRFFQKHPTLNRIPQHPHPIQIVPNAIRYQNLSPDHQIQKPLIQTARPQIMRPVQKPMPIMNQKLSPQAPRQIGMIKRQSPRNQPLVRRPIISPPKIIPQQRLMPSKQKAINHNRKEDYGIVHSIPQQRQQYQVITKINPQNNHIVNVQKQYQLPTPEIRIIKAQSPQNHPAPIFRQNALMNNMNIMEKKPIFQQKRPQSSASSPKLFFNYQSSNQSHIEEQIVINSHNLTKNNSSIKRPKSVNPKLFVTLKKQF